MRGRLLLYSLVVVGGIFVIWCLSGCIDTTPPCYDNPRNMNCMTPDQLKKELNK